MKTILLTSVALAALAPLTLAQTQAAIPSGTLNVEGNSANTIPFWGVSGTYQQVHDDVDMIALNNGQSVVISAIGFRKDGLLAGSTAARTMDVQLTLGATSLNSLTAGNDFATNLGLNPTIVMPYTSVNIPALSPVSVPNPVGYTMPFNQPFPFPTAPGNHFCWEMRFLNNSAAVSMQMDVQSGTATTNSVFGTGCIATGQTAAATITTRTWTLSTGAYRNLLTRGAASAPAAFFLGVTPQQLTLPGLCSTLEFLPLATVSGMTDATGNWDLMLTPGRSFIGTPATTLYGQFVFTDLNLPLGLGLSQASSLSSPTPAFSARIYNAPNGGTNGSELATTATGSTRYYGLVTILTLL